MIMDNRFLISRRTFDADATRYINAVQLADGQALEPEVAMAVDQFVRGCKADGIWNAIKASCIMAGARTISGALVPLVGTAPTPYNFASGDYSRGGATPGLKGNGSTKYLDTNRANNADGQDDRHLAIYASQAATTGTPVLFGAYGGIPYSVTQFGHLSSSKANCFINSQAGVTVSRTPVGFMGGCRSDSANISFRIGGETTSGASVSNGNTSLSTYAFCRNTTGFANNFADARLAFYSIGSAISDLAALDARVSTLVTEIAAAIP